MVDGVDQGGQVPAPNDRAEAALAAALEERARLWDEAHRARALERERDALAQHIAWMEGSLSWRITEPLRTAKAKAMRFRRLAGRAREKLREG